MSWLSGRILFKCLYVSRLLNMTFFSGWTNIFMESCFREFSAVTREFSSCYNSVYFSYNSSVHFSSCYNFIVFLILFKTLLIINSTQRTISILWWSLISMFVIYCWLLISMFLIQLYGGRQKKQRIQILVRETALGLAINSISCEWSHWSFNWVPRYMCWGWVQATSGVAGGG